VSVVCCQVEVCDELVTRSDKSCRLCCVVVCGLETSRIRRPWPALGRSATGKIKYLFYLSSIHGVLRQRDRLLSLSFLNVTLEQMLLSLLFHMAHLGYLPSSFFHNKIKSEQRTKIDVEAYMYSCPCSGHLGRWFVVEGGGAIWFASHCRVFPVALRSVTAPSAL